MKLIACAGNATSGKDTFFYLASRIDPSFERFAFADTLKEDLHGIFENFGVDIFNVPPEEKHNVRDLLVSYGRFCRLMTGGRYFIDSLDRKLNEKKPPAAIITDLRHVEHESDELAWAKSLGAKIVFIQRNTSHGFIPPANQFEEINNEKIRAEADYILEWPTLGLGKQIEDLAPYVENCLTELFGSAE